MILVVPEEDMHPINGKGLQLFPPMSIGGVANEYGEWVDYNFPEPPIMVAGYPVGRLMAIMEELGELSRAVLKTAEGIRGTPEEHEAAAKDAIGDIQICLLGFCHYLGWDITTVTTEAWREVRLRDWRKYPKNGRTE